jgi:hypothetical protein
LIVKDLLSNSPAGSTLGPNGSACDPRVNRPYAIFLMFTAGIRCSIRAMLIPVTPFPLPLTIGFAFANPNPGLLESVLSIGGFEEKSARRAEKFD